MKSTLGTRSRVNVTTWLFAGCMLIFVMVVVGGITRLTGSGLSITRWDIVTGTVPPLSQEKWEEEFSLYKESPQYKHINSHFELDDFKQIYWWEYIHRLLGRLIGIVFLIPFLYFLITRQLPGDLIYKCLLLFFMGGLQGFIGWYMVKSGLVDIPSVSHLRLALHLLTAFFTFGLTFWFALELIHIEKLNSVSWHQTARNFGIIILVLIIIQIIYGAFVAGLKAGYVSNTWPLMGETLIAPSFFIALEEMGLKALVNDMSGVQLVHRYLAYLVMGAIIFFYVYVKKKQSSTGLKLSHAQMTAVNWLLNVVVLQFILGIMTLLYAVPVWLGVLHQVGAFLLFSTSIYLLHRLRRN